MTRVLVLCMLIKNHAISQYYIFHVCHFAERQTPLEACPRPKPGTVGPCVVMCRSDRECGPYERCCGSCPRKCTKVGSVKKGQCPRFPRWGRYRRRCGRPCKRDRDCPGYMKCCKVGRCGKRCSFPRIYHWFSHMFED